VWSALLYRCLAWLLDSMLWRAELLGRKNAPDSGPVAIVANHAGALGPIALCVALPRLYPWLVADMLDLRLAAPYFRKDFTERELGLSGWTSAAVSALLTSIAVHLLRAIGCVPVWSDRRLLSTYKLSSEYLDAGRRLLILPEDPTRLSSPKTGMRPFKQGFARLGAVHFSRAGQRVAFLPAVVSRNGRTIRLGRPFLFDPSGVGWREHSRISGSLESAIAAMLVEERISLENEASRVRSEFAILHRSAVPQTVRCPPIPVKRRLR
jgi:hypothetical protein